MQDKLSKKDMDDLQKIYDHVVNCITGLPEDVLKNENFLMLYVQALMNVLCLSVHSAGLKEEILLNSIKEIWNIKFKKDEVLN